MATPLSGFWFLADDEHTPAAGHPSQQPSLASSPASSPAVPPADAAQLARINAGDANAFRELYVTHYTACWETAYHILHTEDGAEDVLHDVFLRLWQQRATWRITSSLRAYLIGAIRHKALNVLRHVRVIARDEARESTAGTPQVLGTPPESPETIAYSHDLDAKLSAALATMPARRREIITLRWRQHLTVSEIAALLGLSPNAVSIQLTRAREQLLPILHAFERD